MLLRERFKVQGREMSRIGSVLGYCIPNKQETLNIYIYITGYLQQDYFKCIKRRC